ncbi:uncharacterized protein LOC134726731 [Mytilus trossulus]|uniref:uncharacterized protein LOC134726731 n=1 Tax=Mytilus trossulus TaxID=6551 RepID=UPI003007F008
MSRRRKKDYKKVLSSLITMLPDQLKVKLFVADFESGLWRALTSVFDDPVIQGCVFHWTQAIWRKTQELGLQPTTRRTRCISLSRISWPYHFYQQNTSLLPLKTLPPKQNPPEPKSLLNTLRTLGCHQPFG